MKQRGRTNWKYSQLEYQTYSSEIQALGTHSTQVNLNNLPVHTISTKNFRSLKGVQPLPHRQTLHAICMKSTAIYVHTQAVIDITIRALQPWLQPCLHFCHVTCQWKPRAHSPNHLWHHLRSWSCPPSATVLFKHSLTGYHISDGTGTQKPCKLCTMSYTPAGQLAKDNQGQKGADWTKRSGSFEGPSQMWI